MIKELFKRGLGRSGYKIHKIKVPPQKIIYENSFTMRQALKRCIDRGLHVQTVIDVGVPILEGSKGIIKNASLIILETYNFKLTDYSFRYWEMCSYMESLGFLPVENVDFLLRKLDNSFWQMDTFFLPSQDPIFSKRTYS